MPGYIFEGNCNGCIFEGNLYVQHDYENVIRNESTILLKLIFKLVYLVKHF